MDTKEKKTIGIISGVIIILFVTGVILSAVIGDGIETVYYFSQIYSAIFVVLGVVIAMFQYIISSKDQKDARESELRIRERELLEIEKDRIQKAIDLAEYYKDNILKNATIITQLYKNSGIQSILDTIRIEDMKEFDKHELETLLSSEQQSKIEEICNSKLFKEEVAKCCVIYGVGKGTRELLGKI